MGVGCVKVTLDLGQKGQQVSGSGMGKTVSRTAEAEKVLFICKKNRYPGLRVSGGRAVLWGLSDVVILQKSS